MKQTKKWKYVNASSYFIECPTNHTDSFFFILYVCILYNVFSIPFCQCKSYWRTRQVFGIRTCLLFSSSCFVLTQSDLYGEIRDSCFFLFGIRLQVWQHVAVVTTRMPTLQHREPLQRPTPFFFSLELQVRFVEQSQ